MHRHRRVGLGLQHGRFRYNSMQHAHLSGSGQTLIYDIFLYPVSRSYSMTMCLWEICAKQLFFAATNLVKYPGRPMKSEASQSTALGRLFAWRTHQDMHGWGCELDRWCGTTPRVTQRASSWGLSLADRGAPAKAL